MEKQNRTLDMEIGRMKKAILEKLREAAARPHTMVANLTEVHEGFKHLRKVGYNIEKLNLGQFPEQLPFMYLNIRRLFASGTMNITYAEVMDWTKAIEFKTIIPEGYKSDCTLFDLFDDSEDYPRNIVERGVPPNHCFDYVSSTFLNGYINQIGKLFYACVIEPDDNNYREELLCEAPHLQEQYAIMARGFVETVHTKIQSHFDVIIMGESENAYWILWYPGNGSNSLIGRLDKDRIESRDEMKNMFFRHLTSDKYGFTGRAAEFEPKGWVTF